MKRFEAAIQCLGFVASAVHEPNARLVRAQGKPDEAAKQQAVADDMWEAIRTLSAIGEREEKMADGKEQITKEERDT